MEAVDGNVLSQDVDNKLLKAVKQRMGLVISRRCFEAVQWLQNIKRTREKLRVLLMIYGDLLDNLQLEVLFNRLNSTVNESHH